MKDEMEELFKLNDKKRNIEIDPKYYEKVIKQF